MNKSKRIIFAVFLSVLFLFSGYYIGAYIAEPDISVYISDAQNGKVSASDADVKQRFNALIEPTVSDSESDSASEQAAPSEQASASSQIQKAESSESSYFSSVTLPASTNNARAVSIAEIDADPTTGVKASASVQPVKSAQVKNTTAASASVVNINTADAAALDTLPGIGPVIAERIIAYRELNGNFSSTEEITQVKGIGSATYKKLESLICIE